MMVVMIEMGGTTEHTDCGECERVSECRRASSSHENDASYCTSLRGRQEH